MLCCPQCKSPLTRNGGKFVCQKSGHVYYENDGIFQFSGAAATEKRYFPDKDFEVLYNSEERNFWFQVRNKIIGETITRYIPARSRILEVGCGTGFVSHSLKRLGFQMECADLFFEGLQFCKKRSSGEVYYQYNLIDRLFIEEFNAVCMFDVLEHIEDDILILKNMHDALKPGGFLFITVPADMRLWTVMDVYSGHKRRYSAEDLQKKLESAGFRIIRMSYFMTLLYPILLLSRKFLMRDGTKGHEESPEYIRQIARDELQPNRILNSIFYLVFSLEIPVIRSFSFPFGSSLICAAVRKKDLTEPLRPSII
jgi:2-polyprenyl-3-methyl-5-hydroxy-6-metoxy-1,4-benzoquinol methylase